MTTTMMTTTMMIDRLIRQDDSGGGGGDGGGGSGEDVASQTSGLSAGDWIQAGIVIAVGVVLAFAVAWGVRRVVRKYNEMIAKLAGRIAGGIVFVVAFVYGLNSIGVAVGPLVGALGIGGLAIAFALQDVLKNVFAGVLIQIRRPFEIGHLIKLSDYLGRVQDVTLRTVILDAVDGEQIIIPSGDVISNPIENWSANGHRRTDVTIGVPYDADLDEVIPLLKDAMQEVQGEIDFKEPMVLIDEFGGSSVNIRLLVWHDIDEVHFLEFHSRVAKAAKQALNGAGMSVPFPIRTLEFAPDGPLHALAKSSGDDNVQDSSGSEPGDELPPPDDANDRIT